MVQVAKTSTNSDTLRMSENSIKNEEVDSNQFNKITESNHLKLEIDKLIFSKLSEREKIKYISEVLINFLKNNWKFIKNQSNFYYLYDIDCNIYTYKDSMFNLFLSDLSWINYNDSIFKWIYATLVQHNNKYWVDVEIKKFSHYDKIQNIVYVHNNKNKVIKISVNEIKEIKNWDEWIIFLSNPNHEEWNFIEDKTNDNYLDELINSLNFDETNLKKEELYLIIKQYILSLFFPELFSNRPILACIWGRWSWKSFFLEMIILILFWDKVSMWNLPSNEREIKVNLTNDYFSVFDNVDDKVSNKVLDLLCSVCTWGSIKERQLHTNNKMIENKINCFVALTSRTAYFKREDFANRLLIINLCQRKDYWSASIERTKYIENRDWILSGLCYEIQKSLKNFEDYKNYKTSFRISDYANFLLNNNKDKENYIIDILSKLEDRQLDLTNSSDQLLILLEKLLDDIKNKTYLWNFKEWVLYKAKELHFIFSQYMRDRVWIIYPFNNPTSLGINLENKSKSYKLSWINIARQKGSSNLYYYSISRDIELEDIKEIF
jgi:hypothetical protein